MKLLSTILLSSALSLTLFALDKSNEIINYDKENGFVYYADGSIFMIDGVSPTTKEIDIEELEIIETTPLQQDPNMEELEIVETLPLEEVQNTESLEIAETLPLIEENIEKMETTQTIPLTHTTHNPIAIEKTSIPTQNYSQTYKTSTPAKKQKSKDGKFVGNIKLLHILDGKENNYDTTTGSTYYINGGYVTPEINGFSAKVTGYVVGDTGLTKTGANDKIGNAQFMGEKTSNKKDILETKTNIEEAYVKYKDKNLKAQAGHFTLNTPMTKNSTSTVPNLYEGAIVSSKTLIDDTIVVGSHITKMAYGARALSDWSRIGEKTDTAGAVKVYGDEDIETLAGDETLPVKIRRGKFVNFGEIANIDNTPGMSIVGAINKSIQNTTLQAWEYFIYDVANITYVDGMAKFKLANGVKTMVGAQIMHQNIKDTDGNPTLFGVKGAATYKGAQLILAINKSNGDAMLNIWGGDPAYTSMVHSKNAYRPDVTAVKLVGKYKLSNLSKSLPKNLSLTVAHGNFGKSSLKNVQKDATETDIVLKYKPKKNILFKLANVQRETEFDGYKGKEKTQNTTKFVMKYKF